MNFHARPLVTYTLNADDLIASTGADWAAFAQENGARELTEESVVGRSLWDFISDDGTRQVYKSIFRRVRLGGGPCLFPIRCDSPTMWRRVMMRVSKPSNDLIALECSLIDSRTRRLLQLLDVSSHRDENRLTLCSFCLKGLVEPLGWIEIEDAAKCLRLLEQTTAPQVVYAVCPTCEKLAEQLIQ